jgi:hypothetical protein
VVEEGGIFHGQSIMDGSTTTETPRPQAGAPAKAEEKRDEPEVKVP